MRVIIDPGHGGSDTGAVAFGTSEKTLNLLLAEKLATKLEALQMTVDRSLINDYTYSSTELTNLIKESGAALCISCHCNAFNKTARGFEGIHSIHSDGKLVQYITDEIKKTGFSVRRVFSRPSTTSTNTDYYYVIRLTYPKVETVILEFGFMDNADDFALLTDPSWQDTLTQAAALGIQRYVPAQVNTKTEIQGGPILTHQQLRMALADVNNSFSPAIIDQYYDLAPLYQIKPDLAFLQAVHETNWFRFTGIVKKEQNNFAGLGATGKVQGVSFPTMEAGVEAHIQHLYAYSTNTSLPAGRTLYDTRFSLVSRGSACYWEDLNGKWAVPGIGYGEAIVGLQKMIANRYPATPPVKEATVATPSQPAAPHWAKDCNDELLAAGLLYDDHSKTLDQPASEGMVICLINRLRKEFEKNG